MDSPAYGRFLQPFLLCQSNDMKSPAVNAISYNFQRSRIAFMQILRKLAQFLGAWNKDGRSTYQVFYIYCYIFIIDTWSDNIVHIHIVYTVKMMCVKSPLCLFLLSLALPPFFSEHNPPYAVFVPNMETDANSGPATEDMVGKRKSSGSKFRCCLKWKYI